MDMHSSEQYLAALREEYVRGNKKQKTRLLNEARKRTKLNRKVLIRKLTRVPAVADKPQRRARGRIYGVELRAPLIQIWELFEFPCGQRLAPILRKQTERLRAGGGLKCSQKMAELLREMSAKTIDRLLQQLRDRNRAALFVARGPRTCSLYPTRDPTATGSCGVLRGSPAGDEPEIRMGRRGSSSR